MTENNDAKWDAQLRKGTLELAVLGALKRKPTYGLALLNYFHTFDTMQITEGTLYPLLDRLKRDGMLSATWKQKGEERPRKFYALTDLGLSKLNKLSARWQRSVGDLQRLLNSNTEKENSRNE